MTSEQHWEVWRNGLKNKAFLSNGDGIELEVNAPKLTYGEKLEVANGLANQLNNAQSSSLAIAVEALRFVADHCDSKHPGWVMDHIGIAKVAADALVQIERLAIEHKAQQETPDASKSGQLQRCSSRLTR